MDCQVDAALGESFFDFLGEHALSPDFGEGNVCDFVSGCVDDLDFDLVPIFTEECGNMIGLPQCQLRAAGADAEFCHYRRVPTSSFTEGCAAASLVLICRLNNRRTTSTTVVASDSLAALLRVVIGVCITLLMMPRVRASIAISCSGVSCPMRPRTRSISACRIVSR